MMKEIIMNAIQKKQKALSEYDSKRVLSDVGVTITKEILVKTKDEALKAAREIGFPVALKGCSAELMHKTEYGMVKINLHTDEEVERAFDELVSKGMELDGILVQEMVDGDRQFVIGLTRDAQFGPCVMFGLGGIFTEVLHDVSFRVAPITMDDALEMIEEIRAKEILGPFRGSPAVNKEMLAKALVGVGNLGVKYDEIAEIDINPLIVCGNRPIAVDALVVLKQLPK
ncbi:MAG: acetate--CoA ligase family protein [Spirochaetes bacterium]|nr:acetate--CoA ligase family protein [Spirochaetota bacterium]